jgi:hypothetical protein
MDSSTTQDEGQSSSTLDGKIRNVKFKSRISHHLLIQVTNKANSASQAFKVRTAVSHSLLEERPECQEVGPRPTTYHSTEAKLYYQALPH